MCIDLCLYKHDIYYCKHDICNYDSGCIESAKQNKFGFYAVMSVAKGNETRAKDVLKLPFLDINGVVLTG